MQLFAKSADLVKNLKQAFMGNHVSFVDSLVEELFPQEESEYAFQGTSANSRYATLGILSFEAAAALHKSVELWDSLQLQTLSYLKQVLELEGIQKLISSNREFKWRLAGLEREKDLKSLMSAVANLGQKSADIRLQQLTGRFQRLLKPNADVGEGDIPQKGIEAILTYMREVVANTQRLYGEIELLQTMDPSGKSLAKTGLAKDLAAMNNGSFNSIFGSSKSARLGSWKDRTDEQTKVVQKLKASSLWVENADRVVKVLTLMVYVIRKRMLEVFGRSYVAASEVSNTLGATGLALNYANILSMISKMVERPTMVLRNQREDLYRKIPSNVKGMLRKRLKGKQKSFDPDLAADLRRSMDSMLKWMMPLVHATYVWQREHSFGQKFGRKCHILQLQTLYLADKEAVELAVLELLVGLSYIVRPFGMASVLPEDAENWKEWVSSGGLREPRMGKLQRIPSDVNISAVSASPLSTISNATVVQPVM